MSSKILAVAVALLGIGAVQSASAADMPVKAPMLSPVSDYNWTGFYVGLNGGYGTGATTGDILPTYFLGNNNISGGLFGGQFGYNYQMSKLVLGLEADWDWADISGTAAFAGVFSQTVKVKSLGTVRGRIGYAAGRYLVYGTGGLAWGTAEASTTTLTPESNAHAGYVGGGGIEYGMTPNLSLKAEYLYARLDTKDYFVAQGCPTACSAGANINTFRVGANWRFWGQGGSAAGTPMMPASAGPYRWTGLYLGVNSGYASGTTSGDILPVFFGGNFGVSGGLLGGQVGYNYQISNFVLGVEADYDWANITGNNLSFFAFTNGKITSLGSLRGRAGYAWDRYLVYATGGWAWGHVDALFGPFGAEESHTQNGYAAGGGFEYGVTQSLSLKAEYLYSHLSPAAYFNSAGCVVNCQLGANVNTFRLGANWHFAGVGL